jgi:hypothetical protein
MTSIEAALAEIVLLGLRELSHRQIVKDHCCSRATLARRHQGLSALRATQAQNQQTPHLQQEVELLQYVRQLIRRGIPPTRAITRNCATQTARREVGVH